MGDGPLSHLMFNILAQALTAQLVTSAQADVVQLAQEEGFTQ